MNTETTNPLPIELSIMNSSIITPLTFEPKASNRFLVEFPEEFNIDSWCVRKISKPKFANGEWENIRIEFIDIISPSTSQTLFNSLNSCDFPIKIITLDPIGNSVEEWVIQVEKILTIDFGELDYTNEEIQKIFLLVKPINCILNPNR